MKLDGMPASIWTSCSEAYRVIYLATRPEAVYVLHCFQKKAQKTRKMDIELAARRFAQIGD